MPSGAAARRGTGIRWVSPAALHVTLKFLGEQDERVVGDLRDALEVGGEPARPVSVDTTEIGAFPNFRRPRVVWVGMTASELTAVAGAGHRSGAAPLGIPRETRAFQAHLTLGRVKASSSRADATASGRRGGSHRRLARASAVQTVDLMRSELGPGGSRYSVVAAVPLHARGT